LLNIRTMRRRLLLLVALAALAFPAAASADLTLVAQWGSAGTGNGQFQVPNGVAVDAAGNVYAADQNNDRVEKFDSNGVFQLAFGGPGQLNGPSQVKIDPQGNVLVNDTGNYRIRRYSPTGVLLQTIGAFGTGPGQFNGNPRGLGVDAAGNVYVLDAGDGGVVSRFGPDGAFQTSWGAVGSGPGQWNNPHGLGVAPGGSVFVGDTNNRRIDAFDSNGAFLRLFGDASGPGAIGSPADLAVDGDGSVWVADTAPAGLVEFDSAGVFKSRTTTAANSSDRFRSSGVAVGPGDEIFGTDNLASRVLRFRQGPPPPALGQTANAAPVSGRVLVRAPGASRFAPLADVTQIPVGSLVDTSHGTVSLTLAKDPTGTALQSGTFKGGQFKLGQSKSGGKHGLTQLTLTGPKLGTCRLRSAGNGAASAAKRRRAHQLFSSVHGRFSTRGRHSTATVRGTKWLTKDTCEGTLTRVSQGVVLVRDFTLRKTFRLKKGQSHLALAHPLKKKR
jgi:streptogramin lyase